MEKERDEIGSQMYTQYDGDNDAIMRQTHTEREGEHGEGSKTAGPSLEWHFSQVFGERTPGEEVLDGMLRIYYCIGIFVMDGRMMHVRLVSLQLISYRQLSLTIAVITWPRVTKVAGWCCLSG